MRGAQPWLLQRLKFDQYCSAFIAFSLPSALDQLHPPQLLANERDTGAEGQG